MAGLVKKVVPMAQKFGELAVYYGKVELVPPKPSEFGQVKDGIANLISAYKTKKWKNLTVQQAWLNTVVGVEVVCWFFIGEVIGRRKFIGYDMDKVKV